MSMMYVAAASAAVSAFSTYRQGQAMQAQYQSRALAAQYNSTLERQQAEATYAASNAREDQRRVMNREAEGKRAAAIAESGLGMGGSNADFERQQSTMAELDALNVRYEGQLEATGLLNRSAGTAWEGVNDSNNADYARSSTYIGTASTLLSSSASYYGRTRAGGGGGPG